MTAPSAEVKYLWDGTKVRTSSALGQGRLYKGSFVYSVTPTDMQLESVAHDEGRFLASEGCLVIDGREWKNVERQLGKSKNIYLKLTRK